MAAVVNKALLALTAEDLMTRQTIQIPEDMAVRDAAHLLLQNHIGGAPVVDPGGKCVGVFSALDFLRLADQKDSLSHSALNLTCSFVQRRTLLDGTEKMTCTLKTGLCPLQVKETDVSGKVMIVCSDPHCVLTDWQVVNLEKLPEDNVRRFMTPDPVVVEVDTPIRRIARMMVDAHIHRVIVVVENQHPVGVVSCTDRLAAVAYAEDSV